MITFKNVCMDVSDNPEYLLILLIWKSGQVKNSIISDKIKYVFDKIKFLIAKRINLCYFKKGAISSGG